MSAIDPSTSEHPNPERQQLELRSYLAGVKASLDLDTVDLSRAYGQFELARAAARGVLAELSDSDLELFAATGYALANALNADPQAVQSSTMAASRVYSSVARAYQALADRDPGRKNLLQGLAGLADSRARLAFDGIGVERPTVR
ncbi:MAG: hypothetical protein ACOYN3_01715 [Acidimicrobiia bacterium]